MKKIVLSFAAFIIYFGALAQKPVTLTVEVGGIKYKEGTLKIAIFNREGEWLKKSVRQMDINLEEEENYSARFEGLEPGKYAISIVHDKNNNGDLDMGMMGPTEAYGFSNNARGMFGPATFMEAAFQIEKDRTEKINIR